MKRFLNLPIKWKLMVLITLTSFCVLAVSMVALVFYDRFKFREGLVSELSILSGTINSDLGAAIALLLSKAVTMFAVHLFIVLIKEEVRDET